MKQLAGTGPLLRLVLSRDRVLMPAWILALLVGVMALSASVMSLYPTAADRLKYYNINSASATFAVRNGPLYGSSLGELVTWSAGFVVLEVALVSLLTVIRHTRTEEEAGRRELIGSTAVGRHAGLAAAMIATCGANIVFALLVAAAMTARGLPVCGSLALGASSPSPGACSPQSVQWPHSSPGVRPAHAGSRSASLSRPSWCGPSPTSATSPGDRPAGSAGCRRSGGRIGCVPTPVSSGGSCLWP